MNALREWVVWRWLSAFFGGYFWTTCKRCGRAFGGNDYRSDPNTIRRKGAYVTCCVEDEGEDNPIVS
jgi:hypothetical protein